jgi:hypothetical protein
MRNKRFIVLAALTVAALASVSIAAAVVNSGSVAGVSATFNTPNVARSVQKTCKVNGGDSFTYTRATYKGAAVSTDARLNGPLVIWAQSMVDDTTGVGALIGNFRINGVSIHNTYGRIEAALSSGQASGSFRGHGTGPWGELFAGLNGSFTASAGFASGNLGTGSGADTGVMLHPGACVRLIYLH